MTVVVCVEFQLFVLFELNKMTTNGKIELPEILVPLENPLLIHRQLIKVMGFNEAIVFQQVYYWIKRNAEKWKNFRDGNIRCYNSIEERTKTNFDWRSCTTVKRAFRSLVQQWYLVTWNYNRVRIDKTNWYRIDFDQVNRGMTQPSGQIDPTNTRDYSENSQRVSSETKNNIVEEIEIEPLVEMFIKKQAERLPTVLSRMKQKGYIEKQSEEFRELARAMEREGYGKELIWPILHFVLEDEFWRNQIQSIAKLRKKNSDKVPYWLVMFEKMKIEQDRQAERSIWF